jgi:anti-sigma B factor antagonist
MDVVVNYDPSGAALMRLVGNLDLDTAPELRTVLQRLRARSVTRMVIDLTGLVFCDSIGLSAFVDAHKSCTGRGGYLRLANPTPLLERIFVVVGIADALPVYRTVQAARDGDPAGLVYQRPASAR